LILANQIRKKTDPKKKYLHHESAYDFLASGMNRSQVDDSFSLAEKWIEQKFDEPPEFFEMTPEFHAYMTN